LWVSLNLFLAWARSQNPVMFNTGDRDRVRDWVLDLASTTPVSWPGLPLAPLHMTKGTSGQTSTSCSPWRATFT
jgi:hypothetical protein